MGRGIKCFGKDLGLGEFGGALEFTTRFFNLWFLGSLVSFDLSFGNKAYHGLLCVYGLVMLLESIEL